MLADGRRNAAVRSQVQQAGTVATKPHERSPSGCSDTDDLRGVGIPCEMIRPILLSRVKEQGLLICDRVNSGLKRRLVAVATET